VKKTQSPYQAGRGEIQQLLKGCPGALVSAREALDKLKNELGAIPSEENSANESHRSDSRKYIKFLGFHRLDPMKTLVLQRFGLDARILCWNIQL
jgi:hypothetical protein